MAVLERRLPKPTSHFLEFAKDITSQGGEDGILEEIYRCLDTAVDKGHCPAYSKYCVDIGAWDGKHLSNTYNLLNNFNWSGLLVEAEPSRYEQLRALYADYTDRITCVSQLVGFEGEHSLSVLLTNYSAPKDLGFLCIDIDGADYHLWKSVATNCQAIVVCIEFNPTIPNDVYYIQAAQIDVQQGSSLSAIRDLGNSLGYTLIVTTTFNAIFLRNDYLPAIPDDPKIREGINDIDKLHIPSMTTAMFQTYDGELKYVGTKKLLWHKVALNPQKLQILSKRDRKYPFAPTSENNHLLSKIESIQRNCQDAIGGLCDSSNNSDVSQGTAEVHIQVIVKGIQSVIDLAHLPVIEETSMEILNQLLFGFTQKVLLQYAQGLTVLGEESLSIYSQWLVDVISVVVNHGINVTESDSVLALKYFELAESVISSAEMDCSEEVTHVLFENPAIKSLLFRIKAYMVRCHRLQGNLTVAWKWLKSIEKRKISETAIESSEYSLLEKEKKKLYFLLQIDTNKNK